MPTYESICHQCGKLHGYYKPVSEYLNTPDCCGVKTEKVIMTPPKGYVSMDICYDSPIDGRPITSKQARIEDLKRSGCREWEGMASEKNAVKKAEKESAELLDKQLDTRIHEAVQTLKPEAKRALGI